MHHPSAANGMLLKHSTYRLGSIFAQSWLSAPCPQFEKKLSNNKNYQTINVTGIILALMLAWCTYVIELYGILEVVKIVLIQRLCSRDKKYAITY